MPDKPQDPLAYRVFNEIGIIDQLAGAAFREVLPRPLNTAMFGVLNHFVRLGDNKTPSELARIFQVAKPSMTNTLSKLERAGLVVIEPDPEDGRTKRVKITESGRKARKDAVAATGALIDNLQEDLAQVDMADLLAELESLRAFLDRARD